MNAPLQESYEKRVQQLKDRVRAMQAARERLPGAAASQIWQEITDAYGFLMDLSPKSLRSIRLHTLLAAGMPLAYWHHYPPLDPALHAQHLGYVDAIDGLPERFWMTEPPTPTIPRPTGAPYRGRIINVEVALYQVCVSILYHAGALTFIEQQHERQAIVEIGAGYGNIMHNLGAALGDKATCIIVDLPEMLMMSGAFLLVNNPTKSVWVYDEAEAAGPGFAERVMASDFALVPNFMAGRLQELASIAVGLNLRSFQEMTGGQVSGYLDILRARLSYCFYSDNLDCHPFNDKMSSVTQLLAERFDIYPPPSTYDEMYKSIDQKGFVPTKKYLAFPQGKVPANLDVPAFLFKPFGLPA